MRVGRSHAFGEPVFVVWRRYQGRVEAMQAAFRYEIIYLGWSFRTKLLRPLEYAVKSLQTLWALHLRGPGEVWVQLPPTPLLHIAALHSLLHPRVRLVADCHNILFENPWIRTPMLGRLLGRRADVVLVHNDRMYERGRRAGAPAKGLLVLEDRPAEGGGARRPPPDHPRPLVVFPAGFKADEPIAEILEVARAMPEVTFVLTGDAQRADPALDLGAAPDNLTITGWIDKTGYEALIEHADVVLGLTSLPDVQLSAAKEGLGYCRAMVLSDTPLLREMFPKGAVHAAGDVASLRKGLEQALAEKEELEKEAVLLKEETIDRWSAQSVSVVRRLRGDQDE